MRVRPGSGSSVCGVMRHSFLDVKAVLLLKSFSGVSFFSPWMDLYSSNSMATFSE